MSAEMGLMETIYNCRAMRKLKPDPVPEELIVKLIDAANQAPSGSNLQRARWIVVRDADQRAALAAINKKAVEDYLGDPSTPIEALPHHDADKRQRMVDAVWWQADHMHEIPVLVVACMLFDVDTPEEDRWRLGGSIWPGVQNFLLAARANGLGAAPTNLALMDQGPVKPVLGMPPEMDAYCLIPVGWPMGKFGPVTRMPVAETMRWDRWDGA